MREENDEPFHVRAYIDKYSLHFFKLIMKDVNFRAFNHYRRNENSNIIFQNNEKELNKEGKILILKKKIQKIERNRKTEKKRN